MRRLAVVPTDPLLRYQEKGNWQLLENYYNPAAFFDEVYCFSPFEWSTAKAYGMTVVPASRGNFRSLLDHYEIDIVRAYGGGYSAELAVSAQGCGRPVVISLHDVHPQMLTVSICRADYILAVSEHVRRAAESLGVAPGKIIDFRNRIDLQDWSGRTENPYPSIVDNWSTSTRVILHVGRKTQQKNLDTVIRAMARLDEDFVLLAVGPGDAGEYRRLATELGMENRCYFLPKIENTALAAFYAHCSCLCNPSRWEGFGVVFLEALACGAPIITSKIAPLTEFMADGISARLVDEYESSEVIAAAISEVCGDTELKMRFARNGRQVVRWFDKSKVDQLEARIYQDILSQWKIS